jgi:hypothetical protein
MNSKLETKITEEFGKIINKFKVYHHGWDMDGYGYIVDDGFERKLIMTNHSKPYIEDVSNLNYKIGEYEIAIQETTKAIQFLNYKL